MWVGVDVVDSIQKASFQTPEELVCFSHYFLDQRANQGK